jgi:DNA repair protein SbcD/Mre11
MKILHTSDWHIGKRLKGKELKEDHSLFFDWLLTTIEDKQVGVLIVAGDIFDVAHPSNEALKQNYYRR